MTTPALIADIGAANARFALLEGGEFAVSETYAVADYASPIEAVREFLAGPANGHSGHATLSREIRREDAVIALRRQFRHVSVERVLSGSRLMQLYHAIARVDDDTVPARDGREIVAHALADDCKVSREALEMFCAFLGSVAGNLGARGGLLMRLSSYLAHIPTAVIVHPTPAFVGLAYLASGGAGAHRR